MECALSFLLVSIFGESEAMVLAMLMFWVVARCCMIVLATMYVSRRLLCMTFLLNLLPFLQSFCWIAIDFLDFTPGASCSYKDRRRNITAATALFGEAAPSVQYDSYEIVCEPAELERWRFISRRVQVPTVICLIAQIGVPLLYAFMVLGALQRFSNDTVKRKHTQLQLIVLDFLDVCNFFTIFFDTRNFVYFHTYQTWRDPLLVLFALVYLVTLLEVCMAYDLIAWLPGDCPRQFALVSLAVDIPLMALRCLFIALGLQISFPFLAKNAICIVTEIAITISGNVNNPVSNKIREYLSMLPGAEKLEHKVDKERMSETKAESSALRGLLKKVCRMTSGEIQLHLTEEQMPRLRPSCVAESGD